MAGMLTVAAAMMQAGVVLSQPVVSTTPSMKVAHQDFDEAEIGEIAIERRGRPLPRFLNRVHRKFERQPPGRGDPVAHALGEFKVMAIAGRKIRAGLRNADDRLAGA